MPGSNDNSANGIVYHIDVELLRRAREKDLHLKIEKLDEQIESAQRDLMLVTVAEKALGEVEVVLQEMRKIAVQAAEDPKADRKALDARVSELKNDIDKIVASATYDGVNLLDGSMGSITNIIAAVRSTLK